jgi:hypothetical protein
MAQIDGKFFVNGYEATNLIVDFLRESNRPFTCVHFFDVASAPARSASKLANVSSASIG